MRRVSGHRRWTSAVRRKLCSQRWLSFSSMVRSLRCLALPASFGIARPDLDVDEPQGHPRRGQGEGVVEFEPLRPVGTGVDRPQAVAGRVGVVVEAGGVLRHEHQGVRADAPRGGLVMGVKEGLEIHLGVVEKSVSGLGLTRVAVQGRTDRGRGVVEKGLGQTQQAGAQAGIGEIDPPELRFGPGAFAARRRQAQHRGGPLTQPAAPIALQRQDIDRLDPGRAAVVPILASAPRRLPQPLPIGGLIHRAGKAGLIDEGLQQHRRITIAPWPVRHHPLGRQGEHMRAQIRHRNARQDQEPAVGHHPREVGTPGVGAPADPGVARRQLPGRGAKGQGAQPADHRRADQVAAAAPRTADHHRAGDRSPASAATATPARRPRPPPAPRPPGPAALRRRPGPSTAPPGPRSAPAAAAAAPGGNAIRPARCSSSNALRLLTSCGLPLARAPLQPVAHPPRQLAAGDAGLRRDHPADPLEDPLCKCLPEEPHGALRYRRPERCVQCG